MRYRPHTITFLVALFVSAFCTAFTHDALGRMTSDGLAGTQISYNVQDLPVSISRGDSIRVTFKYLADGTKLEMTDSTGAGLLYRGPFIYRTAATGPNGTTVRSLESVPFEGGRLTAGGTLRYVTDHLGSIRAVVNGVGSPLAIDEYEPYGAWRAVPGSDGATSASQPPAGVTLRYRFTGKEDLIPDWTLPYTDFGARLYSPAIRRWLSPDALSEKYYGINPYVYCAGNPVRYVDDGGLDIVLAGKNGSSVTIQTDAINITANVAGIGINWGGQYSFKGNEMLSAALDIAGVVDQTGIADGLNASLHFASGNYFDAAVSALGVVPVAGDLAKLTRVGRDVRIIDNAISSVKTETKLTNSLRKNMIRATGEAPEGMHAHHLLPKKFQPYFERAGININDPKYGMWMNPKEHLSKAKAYNDGWSGFFDSTPSIRDTEEKAKELMKEIYGKDVSF